MDSRTYLKPGTMLDGSYRIGRVVGAGGFGVTYEAEDVRLTKTVAIKEYFPDEFAVRTQTLEVRPVTERQSQTFSWGLKSFLSEARTLAKFGHSSIVEVFRIFEANSTAYMVMEFVEGLSFEAWLRSLQRAPSQAELDKLVGPLLDALAMMHNEAFLHRDIAPDNIIIRNDHTPVLLDFGSARRTLAAKTHVMTGMVKQGYSPQEQYSTEGKHQGPWTDFYALGGTLYRAVSGRAPEEAPDRSLHDTVLPAAQAAKGSYRASFLQGIDACLKLRPADRPQTAAQVRRMLCATDKQTEPTDVEGGGTRIVTRIATEVLAPLHRRLPAQIRFTHVVGAMAAIAFVAVAGTYAYTRPGVRPEATAPRQPAIRLAEASRPPATPLPAIVMPLPTDDRPEPSPEARPEPPAPQTDSPPTVQARPWSATASDVAAWRLKGTTRLGGALSDTTVSIDRATVVVSGHRDGSLHVLDAATLKPRAKIMIPSYEAYTLSGIAIFPDNRRIAVLRNGALETYDIDSKALIATVSGERGYEKGSLTLSKDGQRLYAIRSSINPQRSMVDIFGITATGLVREDSIRFDVRVDSFDATADDSKFILGTYPTNSLVLYDAQAKQTVWERPCACSARFAANDRVIVFAGRPDEAASNDDKPASIGIVDIADPSRRAIFQTSTSETLYLTDVSPDGLMAAIGSTNIGQVMIVPVALDPGRGPKPIAILKDNSGQSISGAAFVGRDAMVTTSGDNNARLWKK